MFHEVNRKTVSLLFNNNLLTKYDIPTLLFNDNKPSKNKKLFQLTNHHPNQQNKKTGPSIRTIQHSNH